MNVGKKNEILSWVKVLDEHSGDMKGDRKVRITKSLLKLKNCRVLFAVILSWRYTLNQVTLARIPTKLAVKIPRSTYGEFLLTFITLGIEWIFVYVVYAHKD